MDTIEIIDVDGTKYEKSHATGEWVAFGSNELTVSYFAKLDGAVVADVVAILKAEMSNDGQEVEQLGIDVCKNRFDKHSGWVQTSTVNGFRVKFAEVGDTYSQELDAFIPPQPFPQYVLDPITRTWRCPVPEPTDGKAYYWDAASWNWIERV